MGDVIKLVPDVEHCACGWKRPKEMHLALEDDQLAAMRLAGIKRVEIVYECPLCGNGFVRGVVDQGG